MSLLLILISGCKDHPTSIEQPKTEIDYGTYDISTYMPLSIGNRWIYEVRGTGEIATLDRRIIDSVRISVDLLMFSFGEDVLLYPPSTNLTLAGYYGHRGGTIYFEIALGPQSSPLYPLLTSPIAVTNSWSAVNGAGVRDTFKIISINSGSFNNQYIDTIVAVKRWRNGWVDTTWFGRTVGILKEVSYSYYSSDTLSSIRHLYSFTPTP